MSERELEQHREKMELLRVETQSIVGTPRFTIQSHEDAHRLNALLVRAKQAIGDFKRERAKELAPHEKEVSRIKMSYASPIQILEDFERVAKGEIGRWTEAEERRVRAEKADEALRLSEQASRLAAAESEGDTATVARLSSEIDTALEKWQEQPVTAFRGETGTASTRKTWKAEIVKPEDVPREYCVPSMPLLNAAVRLGKRSIPGVEISEQTSVSVRIRQ